MKVEGRRWRRKGMDENIAMEKARQVSEDGILYLDAVLATNLGCPRAQEIRIGLFVGRELGSRIDRMPQPSPRGPNPYSSRLAESGLLHGVIS